MLHVEMTLNTNRKVVRNLVLMLQIAVASLGLTGCINPFLGQGDFKKNLLPIMVYASIDDDVRNEVEKMNPPGWNRPWSAHWRSRVDAWRRYGDESRYVPYLIEARRRAGLPPLPCL